MPEAMLFSVAAELDARGVPLDNSYPGLGGDEKLFSDAISSSGLSPSTAYVINDAELAALSAAEEVKNHAHYPLLVLTIGFGLGGAVVAKP